jgi:hypothetical protein
MGSIDYIPHAFNALFNWLVNFTGYLTENLSRFGIADSDLTALDAEIEAFKTAHAKAEHPNAGKADRLDRKEKAKAVTKSVRGFVNEHLRYNHNVTDEDRVKLGLNVADSKPTAATKPETWPVATVNIAGPRMLRLDWHDSQSASKAKPAGVHGCEIRYAILDAPPVSTEDLMRSEFSTRSYLVLTFDESQRGKTVYLCLRWENSRGEKGPWNNFVNAMIP